MTIRLRLAAIYVGAIAITIGLVGALVWWQLGSALRSSLGQTLETRAAAVATSLENNGQSGLQEGDATGPAGVFVAIFDPQGQLIDSTAGVPPGLRPPPTGVTAPTWRSARPPTPSTPPRLAVGFKWSRGATSAASRARWISWLAPCSS